MTNKQKYGSFTVQVNGEDHVVNPLTQKELANGWQLVIPKVKSTRVRISHGDRIFYKYKKNYKIFRSTLAQLPEYLWSRLSMRFEYGEYSHSIAKDGMYLYIVKETPIDTEIRRLYEMCFYAKYDSQAIDEMNSLIQVLGDNNVSGWVPLRAQMIVKQYT